MTSQQFLEQWVRQQVAAIFPDETKLATRTLDAISWMNFLQTGEGISLSSPLILIVEEDDNDASGSPYGELVSVDAQAFPVTVYLVLGESDKTFTTVVNGATGEVVSTSNMYIGQLLRQEVSNTLIYVTAITDSTHVTCSGPLVTGSKLVSNLKADCTYKINQLRQQLQANLPENTNTDLHLLRDMPILSETRNGLNHYFTGNDKKWWSAALKLTLVGFY